MQHTINGCQLFKAGSAKKIRVKDNVTCEKKTFLVKCLVSASMKNIRYRVYVHLCQVSGDILYGKCACKAGCGRCCKHVGAVLYQLVEYRQLGINVVPDDKTCTDIFQKWHVPGEGQNQEPIEFSELQSYKADVRKDDDKGCRKRSVVCGSIVYCAIPVCFRAIRKKNKNVNDDLVLSGKGLVFAEPLIGNNFKPFLLMTLQLVTLKLKKGQKIYKIKIQELQLLECL